MHEARCHGETFFSELRFSVNTNEVYGYRREEGRAGPGGPACRPPPGPPRSVVTSTDPVATDEDVRTEIIATVRRFVDTRGHPRRVRPRAVGHLPRDDRASRCATLGLFGVTIPEEYGGLGLDLLDLHRHHRGAGLRLDEPDRHREHAHHGGHADHDARDRGAEAALAPLHGVGGTAGLPLALRARRRERHPQHLVPGSARRGRVRPRTAARPGSPTASGPPSWRWPPGPRRASPPSSSRRSPGRASRASRSASTWASSGYRGVETVEMAYTDHRIPAANVIGEARARAAADPRRARGGPHQHRGAGGRRGPGRLRRRAGLQPCSARPWARSSASTRRSS